MNRLKKLLGVVGVVLVLFTGCSKNEKIEGKVEDIFGNVLPDVTVKIEKSTFTAKTDDSGLYSLDYAPSSMKLIFSKDGYTTMNLSLDIKKKTHYPAETMVLYPTPKENGIFYIDTDKKKLVKLNNSYIQKHIKSVGGKSYWNQATLVAYYIKFLKNMPTIRAGKSMFIDKVPYLIKPTSIKRNGLFYEKVKKDHLPETSVKYYGLFEDKNVHIGKEKLIVRTIDLSPGLYSYIQMDESFSGHNRKDPMKNGAAFTFKVETTNSKDSDPKVQDKSVKQSQIERKESSPLFVKGNDSINSNSSLVSKQKNQQSTQPLGPGSNQLTSLERQELEQLRAEKAQAALKKQANSNMELDTEYNPKTRVSGNTAPEVVTNEPANQSQTGHSNGIQNIRADTHRDGSETYFARISQRDHYGARNQKLKDVGTILQQDRANYHKYHRRDREDTGDNRFDTRDNRNKIKRMLARGATSQKTLDAIRYGTPLVKVNIYPEYIDVTLESGGGQTQQGQQKKNSAQPRQSKSKKSKCNTNGSIRGISSRGDGFVAVRKGPGTKYGMVGKIYRNGTRVKICDRKGKWKGIIYGDCISGSSRSRNGSCTAGWVYEKYIRIR